MATFDLTVTPNQIAAALVANTGLFPSALNSSAQTIDRQGYRWKFTLSYENLSAANRAAMLALIAQLRGQSNRVRLPVFDNPKRGVYGGTPLVDGASQTGNTLNLKGATATVTNWIRAGDYFSVIVNGEPELKMSTADANSNGSGQIVGLTFEPKLRASPADSAVIYVDDGVLSVPKGIFMQTGAEAGWTSNTYTNGFLSGLTLELIEDVFGTQ